jgi:hypothetical protein
MDGEVEMNEALDKHFSFILKIWMGNFLYTTASLWFATYSHHINHWSSDALTWMSVTAGLVKVGLSYYLIGLYNCKLKRDKIGIDY